jgi:hypothetical protein
VGQTIFLKLLSIERVSHSRPQVLDALIRQGSVPLTKTFGKTIFLLLEDGRLQDAEVVLQTYYQHIAAQPDPQLSVQVLETFVRKYSRAGQPERVMELVKQARAHKQAIPLKDLYTWVDILRGNGHRRYSHELYEYIKQEKSRTKV